MLSGARGWAVPGAAAAIIVAVGLAAVLRLPGLGAWGLWYDEAATAAFRADRAR